MADRAIEGKRQFSDLIGEIGAAWGLPQDACRVHALLYLSTDGLNCRQIGEVLALQDADVANALDFLQDYELAWSSPNGVFKSHQDPWEALMKGLDQRRRRDLPAMRDSLLACRKELMRDAANEAGQIDKMIRLVDDMSAIHMQAFRLSPNILRGVVAVSGRAARFFGGGRHDD